MKVKNLLRCDLNLLVCLHVLLEEQSVTRAASRLCLSQSAVSKNLARLREWFDDPLFVRHSHGLQPTPRAIAMQSALAAILGDIEKISQPTHFDPASSPRRFQLALVESIYPLLLPHFVGEIFSLGPHITLDTHQWGRDSFDAMLRGEQDFGITGKDIHPQDAAMTMMPPKGIAWQQLYQDHQACLLRPEHPALSGEWNLEVYLAQRHLQVRCDGKDRWLLDYKMAEEKRFRDIAVCVPDFNSAASLVTHTDLVFTAPSHFVNLVAKQLGLVVMPLPYPLPPMAYTLFWSEAHAADPGHRWMRELIIDRCSKL
uniref:LysR substrate-binding domain-containing protein n=1 Tax=Thaumasiovibrio occultus TaxID=1891184 RepID=UPI000B358962|nr:LysR substrate-binding domain-containing protein [Thaumasiovibrio occultus]